VVPGCYPGGAWVAMEAGVVVEAMTAEVGRGVTTEAEVVMSVTTAKVYWSLVPMSALRL
jgi:hypothetical protein